MEKPELVFGGFDHPNPLWKKGGEIVEEIKVGITGWRKRQCLGKVGFFPLHSAPPRRRKVVWSSERDLFRQGHSWIFKFLFFRSIMCQTG